MLNFNTAQFKYSGQHRIDITYRTKDSIGKLFCPNQQLVFNYKNEKINKEEYTIQYYQLMRNSYRINKDKWLYVLNNNHRFIFVCYCTTDTFCHRLLLKDILIKLGGIYDGEIG